jgi:DNA-directed RNA polymerase sigma subunit (sigma70/sigma32)
MMDLDLRNYTEDEREVLYTSLSTEQIRVLELRFGIRPLPGRTVGSPLTLGDVGLIMKKKREEVRRIEAQALQIIRRDCELVLHDV